MIDTPSLDAAVRRFPILLAVALDDDAPSLVKLVADLRPAIVAEYWRVRREVGA